MEQPGANVLIAMCERKFCNQKKLSIKPGCHFLFTHAIFAVQYGSQMLITLINAQCNYLENTLYNGKHTSKLVVAMSLYCDYIFIVFYENCQRNSSLCHHQICIYSNLNSFRQISPFLKQRKKNVNALKVSEKREKSRYFCFYYMPSFNSQQTGFTHMRAYGRHNSFFLK